MADILIMSELLVEVMREYENVQPYEQGAPLLRTFRTVPENLITVNYRERKCGGCG